MAQHLFASRIDRVDAAIIARCQQVMQYDSADGVRPVAGAEQGHAAWREQRSEVVCVHGRKIVEIHRGFLNFYTGP